METIFSQHGRGIEGDVFRGRNSRIAAGHILALCGYALAQKHLVVVNLFCADWKRNSEPFPKQAHSPDGKTTRFSSR